LPPPRTVFGSLARITDFDVSPPAVEARPRPSWARGDYVCVEMLPGSEATYLVEGTDGSDIEIHPGDRLIGALGDRAATLEAVGTWRAVGDDLRMQALTAAGVLGVCTSASTTLSRPLVDVAYVGHAVRDGRALNMKHFVTPAPAREIEAPVILIIGTSMNSGKTVAAVAMIRELAAMGRRTVGAKVTGVGRYRDILAMGAAGADAILDFVDTGLPSSLVPEDEYEADLRLLCAKIAAHEPDVVVIEAGASPLEPYRGDVAMRVLRPKVTLTVLCASDPYAVWGLTHAFDLRPDIVTGPCTSTEAGIALIDRMIGGVPALNMFDMRNGPQVARFLREHLMRA
jgi:hypothetical protein